MSANTIPRLLRRLAAMATDAELRELFAEIRRRSDDDLLAARRTAPAKAAREEDFAAAIAGKLAPILAPAAEKAEMLADELAGENRGGVAIRGLAPTIRRLVALHGEEKVTAAAEAVMDRMRNWGSTRERVS